MDSRIIDVVSQTLKFYNQEINPFALEVWSETLKRFTYDQVKHAFNVYIQTSEHGRFCPKPADITLIITGGNADVARMSWSVVERAIKSKGPYRTLIFNDPIIHRVIYDLGGWVKVCGTSEKDFPFLAIDFQNRYKGYMNRGVIPEYPNRLVGIEESSRSDYGLKWQDALEIIGDEKECLVVFKNGKKPDDALALTNNRSVSDVANMLIDMK